MTPSDAVAARVHKELWTLESITDVLDECIERTTHTRLLRAVGESARLGIVLRRTLFDAFHKAQTWEEQTGGLNGR